MVFADKLVLPRAISLVGDGLLVGEPTNLWFMRDTDGDGVADEKTEVANDYGNTTNPEHNANGLMWAMDNWIYSANYTSRFRWLGDGKFARDATVTRGQWGITQDDAGRLFYNSNSDPLRHDAMPTAYLKRNPNFNAAGANASLPGVPSNLRIWPGRITPGVNRGYKTLDSEAKLRSMTAASGPVIYRGTLFPAEFRGDAFVPEPAANLIKRIKVTEKDGALSGANAYEGTEFLTSRDERFRPVNLFNGPDGALYVVDMYRGILQHRIYVTTFLRQQIVERGLDKGIGLGRIWRIVPEGAPKAQFDVGLGRASIPELVAKLGDANGWVRDTAQRLLAEKRDGSANAPLRAAALDPKQPALARLHALWALEGTGPGLDRATVLKVLDDENGRVVAAAIRLSEPLLKKQGGDAEVVSRLAALVKSRKEPEVRLQLALTLGEAKTEAADLALRDLVIEAGRQPFLSDAVVSGIGGRENDFIEQLLRTSKSAARGGDVLRYSVSAILKSDDAARIERVMGIIGSDQTPEWARIPMLAGVRHFLPKSPDGRSFPGNLPTEPKALVALAAKSDAGAAPIAKQLLAQLKWPGKAGAADVTARPLTTQEQAMFDKGKAQFAAFCAACHQPNGQGLAGLAPSLVYSRWVLGDPRILSRIVLNGKVQENLVMPPWKAALDDENIAAVLTFIRRSWGHQADPVSPSVVAETRAATATRNEPFTDSELQEAAHELVPPKK